jgi:hypothetical protein
VFDNINLHSASTTLGIDATNTELAFGIINLPNCTANFLLRADSGWDIYRSDDVTILNSQITNQDDCVSFKPNSTNVLVKNLICDGSHGVSVGDVVLLLSLRRDEAFPGRSEVSVNVCCVPTLCSQASPTLTHNLYGYLDPGEFDLVENVTVSSAFHHLVTNHTLNDHIL